MSDFYEDGEALTITLDGGSVESTDQLYSGNFVSKEGYYHITATGVSVSREEGKLPQLKVDMMVLDGTGMNGEQLVDQVEKVLSHRIFLASWEDKDAKTTKALDDRASRGIRAFAYAFGLISEEDLANPKVNIPFHLIEGRQAIVKVTKDKDWVDNEGKTRTGNLKIAWNNDVWPVTHERVKDVHKSAEALSLLVGVDGTSGGSGSSDLDDI